ncbi:fatty acyl-AMP ligase [Streptomyces sp. NBC_00582]|uniref:fatty acyl-AMP ligase n=1 Tax=Streptomyces sp. NBC_00582 TaxID=2975783 RepID=UPI001AAD0403|nr:fatty acyl-AMP ligase [Streptomyces sp. NBC_00582]WUB59132.1 fatty acyl-AMP ligase [Streptomyces sp. NBC_00582]WUB67597.1 fatty acyl-AMP ligase [Streptomyces sp. NBC_00582]
MTETLGHNLAHVAALTPDETAVTFVDYSAGAGEATSLTWNQLEERVRVTASGIRNLCAPGERVAVVAPQSLAYMVGFLAAACSGAIAVPMFMPSLPGHAEKLAAVLKDAAPALVLTVEEQRRPLAEFCADQQIPATCRIVTESDLCGAATGSGSPLGGLDPQQVAYLQYTSGSTRVPSGVEITHANVCANARQALEAYDLARGRNCTVGWLPLYHDMGLVLAVALPILGHLPSVVMDPLAFIQQPARWLRLLSRYRGALTAAPNFAYDYCLHRLQDEDRAELSLGSVAAMVNGSEPVAARTLERFQAGFASAGMRRVLMRPSYGLAEATVFVCASPVGEEPTVTSFDREALGRGIARAVDAADGQTAVEVVACGRPTGQELAIVDPATCRRREDGVIGEIWLRGPNIGRGYWNREQDSAATFGAVVQGEDGGAPWLRTGDLGVWHDKQLYVTGRLKDLVIIDGTNHYPHDIEESAQKAHPAIRPHHLAAFAVPAAEGERLVVVAEHARDVDPSLIALEEVTRAVRSAVAARHGAAVHDFVLVPPGTVPHTTSGKVARGACRERYLTGVWSGGADA